METRALAQRVLATLETWLQGTEVPPVEAILRAVDLVVDERNALTS